MATSLNNTGRNVSVQQGEGAANILQWNQLDNSANQIYRDQKQKEERGYMEFLAGSQILDKEFANLRSADVPDVMQKYDTLKQAKKRLFFDPKIKNNPLEYAKIQREASILESDLRTSISESRELKESDKTINQRLSTHRDEFDDEKVPAFFSSLNMPTSKRKELGLIGDTPYRYQGVDMAKLGQIAKAAMGTAKEFDFGAAKVADEGYKIEQKRVLRGNNPVQYAESLYKGLQTNKYGQGARAMLGQMPPTKIAQIQSAYNAIPDADFEQKWGIKKSELNGMLQSEDKVGQFVALDAMKYAVDNLPQLGKSTFRANEAFRTAENNEEWQRRNKITSGQSDRRAELNYRRSQENKPIETFDYLKKGVDILGSGSKDMANQYFSSWKAQSKTGATGDVIGFNEIDYTPAGYIKIKYNVPVTKNGVTVGLPQETLLNPKDPQLVNKLSGLHQQFMGSDVKVEKRSQQESMKNAGAVTPKVKPKQVVGKKDSKL